MQVTHQDFLKHVAQYKPKLHISMHNTIYGAILRYWDVRKPAAKRHIATKKVTYGTDITNPAKIEYLTYRNA